MLKHEKSIKFLNEARKYFPQGVGSSVRRSYIEGKTLFFERGKGSKIYDVDGNEYIDYMLGFGPLVLGHCPINVMKKVKEQLELGTEFGASDPKEIILSKKICECIPSVEQVTFNNSATESVQMALRIARAYTGKSKFMKFEGCYHGSIDNVNVSVHPEPLKSMGPEDYPYSLLETGGQYKRVLEESIILPLNKLEIVEKQIRRYSNDVAALIIEPVPLNNGVIPLKEGFLEGIREITKKHEIVLIFDETMTGFRLALGGAQEYYNVIPDLTVFGKAVAAGYPFSGYGGKKEIMRLLDNGVVGHYGTFNSCSLCVSASIAAINELSKNNGEAYSRMNKFSNKLIQGIKEIFLKNNIPAVIQSVGSIFGIFFLHKIAPITYYRDLFNVDRDLSTKFWVNMLDKGIRVWTSPRGLWFVSTAHSEEDSEKTLGAVEDVAKILKR